MNQTLNALKWSPGDLETLLRETGWTLLQMLMEAVSTYPVITTLGLGILYKMAPL